MKLNKEEIKNILVSNGCNEKIVDEALSAKKFHKTIKRNWHELRKNNFEKVVDIPLCVKLYENKNVPIFRLAMAYGVSDVSLREYMIKHGVNLKGHKCGINSQNRYFQNIDSKDKAYFLGLLAADGGVVWNKKSATISLELKTEDKYIIDRFNSYGNFNAYTCYDRRIKKDNYRIFIGSTTIANDLSKYGIIQNKSSLNSIFIPNIERKLIPHFIRGYFDGDGIANKHGYIGFCGSKTIIEQIHDYFIQLYEVSNTKITYNKSNHIYYIQWGKKHDTKIISDVLYYDCDDLYLTRKKQKIFNRLQPETWKHVDLNLNEPINIGCPEESGLTVEVE